MFVNRKSELEVLEKRYNSPHSELFILYGRRRVGKTELLKQFIRNKKHVYFMADLSTENELIKMFAEVIVESLNINELRGATFKNWDALFNFLAEKARNERLIVVIDEFTYLISANPAFSSTLQRIWDTKLKDTKIFLILCGSYISTMEEEVLGIKSPLYGRRTGQFLLKPIDFLFINEFFPKYNIDQLIEVYAILGGIPAYLINFDDNKDIYENIKQNILRKDSFLFNEVRFLLMQELRDTKVYFSIIKSIAQGNTKLNDILMGTGLPDRNSVSRYLNILQEMDIIVRELPVTEKHPEKSRKGLYKIKNQFTSFWFRYVFPNISFIEEDNLEIILNKKILPSFNEYVSWTFEDICIDLLKKMNTNEKLPFIFERIGRWWDKTTKIDIVAYNNDNVIFGECKWRKNEKMGIGDLNSLRQKANRVNLHGRRFFYLFSRAGFKDELKNLAKEDSSLRLFDLEKIETILKEIRKEKE